MVVTVEVTVVRGLVVVDVSIVVVCDVVVNVVSMEEVETLAVGVGVGVDVGRVMSVVVLDFPDP